MNKAEFMRQLDSLLKNISEQERQEALQYYDDYFNDAGPENEQTVIEALGNPARVAENIKRDLYGVGYGDIYETQKPVTGRELAEYDASVGEAQGQNAEQQAVGTQQTSISADQADGAFTSDCQKGVDHADGAFISDCQKGVDQADGAFISDCQKGADQADGAFISDCQKDADQVDKTLTSNRQNGSSDKKGLSGGMIALIVILCILASPVLLGLAGGAVGLAAGVLGVLIGVIVAWFCLILGFGIAALVCLIIGVVLAIVGAVGMGIHPLSGVGIIGGGLLTAGIGVLFMMLTVALAGITTPAICRGIGHLFTGRKKA